MNSNAKMTMVAAAAAAPATISLSLSLSARWTAAASTFDLMFQWTTRIYVVWPVHRCSCVYDVFFAFFILCRFILSFKCIIALFSTVFFLKKMNRVSRCRCSRRHRDELSWVEMSMSLSIEHTEWPWSIIWTNITICNKQFTMCTIIKATTTKKSTFDWVLNWKWNACINQKVQRLYRNIYKYISYDDFYDQKKSHESEYWLGTYKVYVCFCVSLCIVNNESLSNQFCAFPDAFFNLVTICARQNFENANWNEKSWSDQWKVSRYPTIIIFLSKIFHDFWCPSNGQEHNS